jgi:hypothetical protein
MIYYVSNRLIRGYGLVLEHIVSVWLKEKGVITWNSYTLVATCSIAFTVTSMVALSNARASSLICRIFLRNKVDDSFNLEKNFDAKSRDTIYIHMEK